MSKEQYFNVDWCRWQGGDVSDSPAAAASQRGEVSVLTIISLPCTPSPVLPTSAHFCLHQCQWLRALQTPIKRRHKNLLPLSVCLFVSMPCPPVLNLFLCLYMSCPSVLTLSLGLSRCDTKRCPTVRPCSHLSHLRAGRYLFRPIAHFGSPLLFFHFIAPFSPLF